MTTVLSAELAQLAEAERLILFHLSDRYTAEEWMRIININLSGVFYVTQAVAKGMLARRYGRILTLGSVSSLLGHPFHAPYAASKGGIAIMIKALATEWATSGVTVNAIGPAYTETALISELNNLLVVTPPAST